MLGKRSFSRLVERTVKYIPWENDGVRETVGDFVEVVLTNLVPSRSRARDVTRSPKIPIEYTGSSGRLGSTEVTRILSRCP